MADLKVLIVDEDPDSRVAMRRAAARADLEVAGEARYGTEAVSLAVELRPEVILVSVEEPAARALDTADGLANALPETPIVIYSTENNPEALRRSMVFGARDYLLKPVDAGKLRESIEMALSQEERRQMRRAGQLQSSQTRGMVITVAGAKGGIGKSVVSVNLAVALRVDTGRSVVIIDADTQFGDVATMLDLLPTASVGDVLKQVDTLDRSNVRQFVTTHGPTGLDVVAASDDEEAWFNWTPEIVQRVVDVYAQVYDFVIVDTSGSMDRLVHALLETSTLALVVSSGDVSAVRDTAAAVRRIEKWGIDSDRVRYVLNEGNHNEGITADELAEALDRKIFWAIPHDRSVIESVQIGFPIVLRGTKSRAAQNLLELARRISGTQSTETNSPFWRRALPLRVLRGSGDDGPNMERFAEAIHRYDA